MLGNGYGQSLKLETSGICHTHRRKNHSGKNRLCRYCHAENTRQSLPCRAECESLHIHSSDTPTCSFLLLENPVSCAHRECCLSSKHPLRDCLRDTLDISVYLNGVREDKGYLGVEERTRGMNVMLGSGARLRSRNHDVIPVTNAHASAPAHQVPGFRFSFNHC